MQNGIPAIATPPKFEDFDNETVYKRYEKALFQVDTQNIVIEFDETSAKSALDLTDESIRHLLHREPLKKPATRWISIFGPERQKKLVKELAIYYGFSPRLLGVMCSNHLTPVPVSSSPNRDNLARNKAHVATQIKFADSTSSSDLEKNDGGSLEEIHYPTIDMNHYKIANEVWHYNSVDYGSKYLCISYNSLADTSQISEDHNPKPKEVMNEGKDHSSNKPKGARTWTWLVLCDDGTVISLHETPFPYQKGSLNRARRDILSNIRRNFWNVFSQISRVKNDKTDHPINRLEIRPSSSSDRSSNLKTADSSSLLFYYLFDDWYTSYALVAKNEYQYAHQLEKLRTEMFSKPQVPLINQLHQYGRELAVLKRMYQSYALIIESILNKQKSVNMATAMSSNKESPAQDTNISAETQTLGAPLSVAATVRFERLLDRIRNLALSEIEECLTEKESLVFMNFNLLAMKESQAVERLTRTTILLAKVTILFMPVSIMTAYFSTQLSDIVNKYTMKTYWICFAVIMALSFIFLALFGLISGTLEGRPIYRTFTQTVYYKGKRMLNARRDRVRT